MKTHNALLVPIPFSVENAYESYNRDRSMSEDGKNKLKYRNLSTVY